MGNTCKTVVQYNSNAETYYSIALHDDNDEANAKEKVKLVLRLTNVNNSEKYQVKLVLYNNKTKTTSRLGGETESISKGINNEIKFSKYFIMEYYFEREQPLAFQLFKGGEYIEDIQVTLGGIMGARGQKLEKAYAITGASLVIQGLELKNENKMLYVDCSCRGNFKGMAIAYLITQIGTANNPANEKVYKSEVKQSMSLKAMLETFVYNQIKIPAAFLSPEAKYDEQLLNISVYDLKHNKKLGERVGSITSMCGDFNINLLPNNTASFKVKLEQQYSFIDFLRGGMEINLSIGIDFTSSNKPPTDPTSLHYIGTNNLNAYEKAISSCGNIVAYYDYDQMFPVYGYGAKLPNQAEASMIFPINMNPQDPQVNTIMGVLQCYRQCLSQITLFGPTCFAPIINAVINEVKLDQSQGKSKTYKILMILTDGLINDMDKTIDALVEASFLPISVIIIGIGNGDFGNMDVLDADDNPLFDKNNRKADRDLVQFVPFNKFENDGDKLAEQVLEEIPRQVVEYFQHNNIQPGESVFDIRQGNLIGNAV